MKMILEFKAEYTTSSLWAHWLGLNTLVEPDTLGLSEQTQMMVRQYAAQFDRTMEVGFGSQEALDTYTSRGFEIWRRLRDELGDEYSVWFHVPHTSTFLKVDERGTEVPIPYSEHVEMCRKFFKSRKPEHEADAEDDS